MQKSLPTSVVSVARALKTSCKSLVLTDLVFKIIGFIVLTPIVSLLFRIFLSISGRTVLADTDIALFLLHPLGWLTAIIVGGAVIAVIALEQAALMTIVVAAHEEKTVHLIAVFRFLKRQAAAIFQVTSRIVVKVLLVSAPFLGVGAGLFLLLLTQHDINFYLTEKPPVFWLAVGLIGIVLSALAYVLLRLIVSWAFALPLLLFEQQSVKQVLDLSRDRAIGHRTKIARSIVVWFVLNSLISSLLTGVVFLLARVMIPGVESPLWQIALAVGLSLILWSVVNFVTSMLATLTFGIVLSSLYLKIARSEEFEIPEFSVRSVESWPILTRTRIVLGFVLGLLIAATVGVTAVQSIQLEDRVDVTAHRGASGSARLNTLAAIRQAIEEKADWVEIDVQESKDGVVIVAHDSDLKKVSGEDFKIWEATADELRAVDIGSYFDPKFKDERVPTLAEVLELCRGKIPINIELKYYGHDQQLEQRVVDLVEQHEMEDHVVIMSLKLSGIQKLKELRPDWTAGLLTSVAAGDLTRAEADFLAVNKSLATRSLIRSAHAREKPVHVWTLNDAVSMSTMISRGADNLITDYPALARKVLAERAEMTPAERLLLEVALFLGEDPVTPDEELRP